jgi:hypothetical protein
MIVGVPVYGWGRILGSVFLVALAGPETASAQSGSEPEPDAPFAFSGPAAPGPGSVITRDDEGRATVRATRLTAPLRVDGRLDEAVYSSLPPISDFIQSDPIEGVPATEKTEVWLLFDDRALYVTFRVWETQPDQLVANEMRRDSNNIFQNDHVAFLIDPFYDRRNGIELAVNPIGGRWDGQISNERTANGDWTLETAVPFKSLRYQPGRAQIWGFNARRIARTKNETSFLTKIPRAAGPAGLFRASLAATMVGLEAPQGSRNIEVKPYAVSNVQSDLTSTPRVVNDPGAQAGVDVRYGITQNISADFTYNTDFAQVEADEQQVNLTRFNLFFPEKREFFLENQGTFGFGGQANNATGDTPVMFYSRRIGFDQGVAVPIEVGGRVTGRSGRYTIGALNITADDDRVNGVGRTNFSVARLRRDILRRSSIGVIATNRSQVVGGPDNQAYGADGTFAFFNNLTFNTYWARTQTAGKTIEDTSYRGHMDYAGDRYGVELEHLAVGDNFLPEIGFVRRDNIRKSLARFRFSPRPKSGNVRRYNWHSSAMYIENWAGRVDTRRFDSEMAFEFQNSDAFYVGGQSTYEFLPQPLRIVGITVPSGGYDYASGWIGMNFGRQRKTSGTVFLEKGTLYGGNRTALNVTQGRFSPTPQLAIEPTYQGNWLDLPFGKSTTHLAGTRVTYTMMPTMFTSALVQFNTGTAAVSANWRFRWEYRPGSELFIVYNEQRDTGAVSFPDLQNRALIVKVNRLVRF